MCQKLIGRGAHKQSACIIERIMVIIKEAQKTEGNLVLKEDK